MNRTLIIAEVGVNHDGSLAKALELVHVAADAGADVVKFQTFDPAQLVTDSAPQATYQRERATAASQREMLEGLYLDDEAHARLVAECERLDIEFLSTAFDVGSLERLVALGLRRIKVPSGELTNGPLLLAYARTGLDLIVSTGMATLGEVEDALAVISFGRSQGEGHPTEEDLRTAWPLGARDGKLHGHVTLLHCTSAYPCPPEDVNLAAMATMERAFALPVGYSDHTLGVSVPVAAVAMGAKVIEKHITLDRTAPGPDHAASIEPDDLVDLVKQVRLVEQARGNGVKTPAPSELENIDIARRSIYAAESIEAGEQLTEQNLTILRPGGGLTPMAYWKLIGSDASNPIAAGEGFGSERA